MSLVEETLFGTVDKVQMAIERLKTFEPPEGYYLAFSGGKDSQCIYHLAEMAGVKFDAHYNVTTIDPPELVYFIRKYYPTVAWDRPDKSFLTRIPERGFPLRRYRWCCREYKERGGSGRRVVTGVRNAESTKRAGRRMVEQCYRDETKTYINPIIDWKEEDVWEFIRSNSIPYCKLYDQGFKRIGCIMCPMTHKRKEEAVIFPGYRKAFERAFEKLWQNRKDRRAYQRWNNGKEMFEWWLSNTPLSKNTDQGVMFE